MRAEQQLIRDWVEAQATREADMKRLIERLAGKITIDFDTARRLFTLVCVLLIKG